MATCTLDIDTTIVYKNTIDLACRFSADDAILNLTKYALDVALERIAHPPPPWETIENRHGLE